MPLKNTQIRTFLEDYFSALKMTLYPENKKFYERFDGNVPVEELLNIKYFKQHYVNVKQLVEVVSKSRSFVYDAEKRTFTLAYYYQVTDINRYSLLFAGIESSNFPTINKDIKWYIAKLTNVFPKYTYLVTSRVFGESNFVGKIIFESEAAAQKVYEYFGSQSKWDQDKIEQSTQFFASKAWKTVSVNARDKYVERMMSHKDEINKFLICLRYVDLPSAYPPNLVVHLAIENADRQAIWKWFTQICKFVYFEYEDNDFRVLMRNCSNARDVLVAKHMWAEKVVKFALVDSETEARMWKKCIEHEMYKNAL